ncbi:MAG TPA: Uma2 family endonuclease [Tepidisphaeraceae bacterium]|jgi:Uma2 family endonuclease
MQTAVPRVRRWTYDEFSRLADLGFFRGRRVELIGGRIIELAPQRDIHSAAVALTQSALTACYGSAFWIRVQFPLAMGKGSGPEPDLSVVPGSPRDYVGTGHPTTALLVVEVSDTTLRYDRRTKGGLYAKHGIQDYWIVNLIDRVVEVYRDPISDLEHPFRHRYDSVTHFSPGQSISAPSATGQVHVSDLLP